MILQLTSKFTVLLDISLDVMGTISSSLISQKGVDPY